MRTILTSACAWLLASLLAGCGVQAGSAALARSPGEEVQHPRAAEVPSDTAPVFRRVWVGGEPDFYASTPSPDGRYVTEIDWVTGDLAVLDLQTDQLRRVTDKGSWSEAIEWAESSTFSPDGRRIAYNYWSEERDGYEVRVIDVDGGNERPILPHRKGFGYAMVEDWSGDGASVLATLWWSEEESPQGEEVSRAEIALISAVGGDVRVLKTTPSWEAPEMAVFSPDDRFVAFDLPKDETREDHDIYVMRLDGGEERALVTGPSDDRLMGWAPDGKSILFYSDREFTQGVWRLPVRDGRPAGEPSLVKADVWGLSPLGFARGSYLYGVTLERPQVYTASVDVGGGRVLTQPAPVEDPARMHQTGTPVWSADGRQLAYFRQKEGDRSRTLVLRSLASGEMRELPVALRNVPRAWWAPGGQSLIVVGREPKATRPGLFRIHLADGSLEELPLPDGWPGNLRRGTIASDGNIYYVHQPEGVYWEASIRAFDPSTGGVRDLVAGKALGAPALAPDERTLALVEYDRDSRTSRLVAVSVSGGPLRELPVSGIPKDFVLGWNDVAWTPDGRYLLNAAWNEETDEAVLLRIPSAGGEATVLMRRPPGHGFRALRLSPDGQRIAFRSGRLRGEIWRVDNLPGTLPALQAGRPDR